MNWKNENVQKPFVSERADRAAYRERLIELVDIITDLHPPGSDGREVMLSDLGDYAGDEVKVAQMICILSKSIENQS